MMYQRIVVLLILSAIVSLPAFAQSSSLYVSRATRPQAVEVPDARVKHLTPLAVGIRQSSWMSVELPKPKKFAVHDLVTVVIREQSSATSESTLETEKELKAEGAIDSFLRFRLKDLAEGQLEGKTLGDKKPQFKIGSKQEFDGSGDYERKDSMMTRITARIIDVKPNGLLALEARTNLKNDDEVLTIKLTGYCKAEDVSTIDNSIISTNLFDLRVDKQHSGELRKASKKGWITKFFDALFNF